MGNEKMMVRIVFTDTDCRISTDSLNTALEWIKEGKNVVVEPNLWVIK